MKVKKIVEKDMTISASSGQATASLSGDGITDIDQCIVFSSYTMPGDGADLAEDRVLIDVWVDTAGTQVVADRTNATATHAVTVKAYVVEFGTDTTVYRGTFQHTDTGTSVETDTQTIGGTVTLANSFVLATWRGADGGGGFDVRPGNGNIAYWISSTTQVSFRKNRAYAQTDGHWVVVESSTLSVQHEDASLTTSSTGTSFTHEPTTSPVDDEETFLISTWSTDEVQYNDAVWCGDLETDGTDVRFRRGWDYNAVYQHIRYQLVSDTSISVQRGELSPMTTATLPETDSITQVSPTLSIVRPTGTSMQAATTDYTQDSLNQRIATMELTTATTAYDEVTGDTDYSVASDSRVSPWEVITFTEDTGAAARRIFIV